MDIQKLFDTLAEADARTRANYHLTLGDLIEALKDAPPATPVEVDVGGSLSGAHSYRGYYEDLAFEPEATNTAGQLANEARNAMGTTYQGYKGGDFKMHAKTPLWLADYGSTGLAIIGIAKVGDKIVLSTKSIG
jgi:hypothetical protein